MKKNKSQEMPEMMSQIGNKQGFTLIELLIVISIIIVLVSLVTAGFTEAKKTAFATNTQARCGIIRDAILSYWNDCHQLPDGDNVMPGSKDGAWVAQLALEGKSPPYLDLGDNMELDVPKSSREQATGKVYDDWGFEIFYRVVGSLRGSEDSKRQDQLRAAALTNQAFFVWSPGPNGQDDFTDAYEDWDLNLSSDAWKRFTKLADPMEFALQEQVDDIIVGN